MSNDKNFQEILDKAQELETFNFAEETKFDVGEYYTALEKIAKKNENFKNDEAENVVEQQAKEHVVASFIEELQEKRKVFEDFIRRFDPNSDEVKEMELEDVDRVYAISNYLLNAYIQHVNEMQFTIQFTRIEAKWLNKVLLNDIQYNGDEVFNFVEFFNNFWEGVAIKLEEDKSAEVYTFNVRIKDLLILHHLIKGHTVKGKTHDFKHFQSILYKIATVNKLFNAYNIIIERIKNDRELWGNSIDEVVKMKDPEYRKQLEEMQAQQAMGMPALQGVTTQPVTDADLGK